MRAFFLFWRRFMTRFLLGGLLCLLGLLVVDRIRGEKPHVPAPVALDSSAPPARAPTVSAALARDSTTLSGGTPAIDLLARLEGRRRLARATAYTYFDSLFTETDSVLRRWAAPSPLLVAILPDSGRLDPTMVAVVRRALEIWEEARVGVRFTLASDSAGAQLVVQSTAQFEGDRVGQTHLIWSAEGVIRSALITLARTDTSGRPLPGPVALAVAVHEVGHALGLAHSPSPDDVMFQMTRSSRLSERDRRTITLLYELPLGSIRERGQP